MQSPFAFNDSMVRFGIFAGLLVLFALIEFIWPRRQLIVSKGRRWVTNLGMLAITGLIMRFIAGLAVPLTAIAAAFYAQQNGLGLLNHVDWPSWLKVLIVLAVLDLAIWAQHLASHKIPILWRIHRVHHADRDIDVTTAIRFHPIEIVLSMLWKIAVVMPLGASPFAVFLFEAILNGCALFNHSNINLPRPLDRLLRLVIVTPDMHRVHHSVYRTEHDSNYGFNLSIWDRLFRTYTAQPKDGHLGMRIGLIPYQTPSPTRLGWSLLLPFLSNANADGSTQKSTSSDGPKASETTR
ncbi:MAG: sterol desaturase family protein [Methyloceanibacter sp.]|nr:sterol desaturase family protein [Methyloceanibacter sp.]